MLNGQEFIEKLYSDIEEYEEEKLYSTGDEELVELLEKAFCEGYEYAQREYNSKAQKLINNNLLLKNNPGAGLNAARRYEMSSSDACSRTYLRDGNNLMRRINARGGLATGGIRTDSHIPGFNTNTATSSAGLAKEVGAKPGKHGGWSFRSIYSY